MTDVRLGALGRRLRPHRTATLPPLGLARQGVDAAKTLEELLGERGQAKSRLVRGLTALHDEEAPTIKGAEIAVSPFPDHGQLRDQGHILLILHGHFLRLRVGW